MDLEAQQQNSSPKEVRYGCDYRNKDILSVVVERLSSPWRPISCFTKTKTWRNFRRSKSKVRFFRRVTLCVFAMLYLMCFLLGYRTTPILYINGERVPEKLAAQARPNQTLLSFLRDVMLLTGSKLGCAEGGGFS